jgi:hypothetical protein
MIVCHDRRRGDSCTWGLMMNCQGSNLISEPPSANASSQEEQHFRFRDHWHWQAEGRATRPVETNDDKGLVIGAAEALLRVDHTSIFFIMFC